MLEKVFEWMHSYAGSIAEQVSCVHFFFQVGLCLPDRSW